MPPSPPPELRKVGHAKGRWIGDEMYLTLGGDRIVVYVQEVGRGRESGDCFAIAKVLDTVAGTSFRSKIPNLLSHRSRDDFRKGAEARKIPIDTAIWDDACELIYDMHLDGESAPVWIPDMDEVGPIPWYVPGWIPLREITVLYGDGDAAKSRLALALAIAGLTKTAVGPWLPGLIRAVLYLDWETGAATVKRRTARYCKTANLPEPPILYQRMTGRLSDQVRRIRKLIVAHDIDLVIVDSLSAASGGEVEGAEAALRTHDALRRLGVTVIVVAHISGTSAQMPSGTPRPYGSVFNRNMPRATIFVALADTDDDYVKAMTVTQNKSNDGGPRQRPMGLTYKFDENDHWAFSTGSPDIRYASPLAQAVDAIRNHGPLTTKDLTERLGLQTKDVLNLMRLETFVRTNPGATGRGSAAIWGLASDRQEN